MRFHEPQDGELCTQFVGPLIFGGESMGVADVEWALAKQGVVTTDLEEDPKGRSPDKSGGMFIAFVNVAPALRCGALA